ncbi:MFS transporter [Simkania sp.]|uniref:MFS transporter n=1 Tax=Simkania sp. TaxID=34094 RepID=UPI003B5210B2
MSREEPIQLHPHPRPFFPWAIWFLSALFLVYREILIVSPSIMIPELESSLKASTADISLIASMAIIPFILFQIPFGILIDRFGPRRITSFGILTAAIGCLIFAMSYNTFSACFGRALIGIGGAVSFVNVVKILSNWFKPQLFASILGATISLAVLGILFGDLVLVKHIQTFGWRGAMIHYTIIGVVLAILHFIFVSDKNPALRYDINPRDRSFNFGFSFKKLLKQKQTWILTAYATFSEAPLFIFVGVWALPFLTAFHQLSLSEATFINNFYLIATALFAPLFGYLSTKMKNRKIFLMIGTLIATLSVLAILHPPTDTKAMTIVSFFCMGIGVGVIPLCYVVMHERTVPQLTATSAAILNTFFALLGAAGDQFIGLVLDKRWVGSYSKAIHSYSAESLQRALLHIPIWFGVAFVISLFIKDTKAKQKYFED